MIGAERPLVELTKVSKIYGEGASRVCALRDVDLQIRRGEFVAVMGPSGSGKSTCMNLLGCLDRPDSGRHVFHGHDVRGLTRDQRAILRRRYLGFVFQGFQLLPRTTAIENVELPLIYRGLSARERRERALRALEEVGLGGRQLHTPSELSGGQQQRVAIARAIVSDPTLLVADEPTGNLDSSRTVEIMELMVELNRMRGITIVLVTHEDEVARYGTRTIRFRDGRIVSDVSNATRAAE
jgi:putative ABC transport system ATP-binding protein